MTNLDIRYDEMGNITARSDVYAGADWTYDAARKHAVRQAGSSAYRFDYDANGNVSSLKGFPMTWMSFDRPQSITMFDESVQFAYNHPDSKRWVLDVKVFNEIRALFRRGTPGFNPLELKILRAVDAQLPPPEADSGRSCDYILDLWPGPRFVVL